ncbi:hypothetical protein LIER_30507 [Lithospermum erythrorhizon]|uniref:Uncharacterized protein n=1 Tax=Lithospermum erythrorhizon TaxID=34254 RepID=A0AAV3RT34_LITER
MAPKIDTSKLPHSNIFSSSSTGIGVTTRSMSKLTDKQGLKNFPVHDLVIDSTPPRNDSLVPPVVPGDLTPLIKKSLSDPALFTNSKSYH